MAHELEIKTDAYMVYVELSTDNEDFNKYIEGMEYEFIYVNEDFTIL